jgi:hypothetical protein
VCVYRGGRLGSVCHLHCLVMLCIIERERGGLLHSLIYGSCGDG